MKKRLVPLLVSVLALGGVIISNPTPAAAAPTNCSAVVNDDYYVVGHCNGGDGQFRLHLECWGWGDVTSSWVNWDAYAVAGCPTGRPWKYWIEYSDPHRRS